MNPCKEFVPVFLCCSTQLLVLNPPKPTAGLGYSYCLDTHYFRLIKNMFPKVNSFFLLWWLAVLLWNLFVFRLFVSEYTWITYYMSFPDSFDTTDGMNGQILLKGAKQGVNEWVLLCCFAGLGAVIGIFMCTLWLLSELRSRWEVTGLEHLQPGLFFMI